MPKLRSRTWLTSVGSIALGLGLLAACAPRVPMVIAPFAIGPVGDGRSAGVERPAGGAAPSVTAPTGTAPERSTVAGKGPGSMSIRFEEVLAQDRSLLAVVSQVASVKIKLQFPGTFDPGTFDEIPGPTVEATIDRTALEAGTRSHTFTGLEPNTYWITVEAYDGAGILIGVSGSEAEVVDATPVVIRTRLQLQPTLTTPTPRPTAAGGSGGSGSGGGPAPTPTPANGAIDAAVSLVDGVDIVVMPKVAGFDVPGTASEITMTPDGHVAVIVGEYNAMKSLQIYERDGTLVRSTDISTSTTLGKPVFDGTGKAYVCTTAGLVRIAANGTRIDPPVSFAGVLPANEFSQYNFARKLHIDASSRVWAWLDKGQLVRVTPAGTIDLELDIKASAFGAAADDQLWTATGPLLHRRDLTGQVVETRDRGAWKGVKQYHDLMPLADGTVWTEAYTTVSYTREVVEMTATYPNLVQDANANSQGAHFLGQDHAGRPWVRSKLATPMLDGRANAYRRLSTWGRVAGYFMPEGIEAGMYFTFDDQATLWMSDSAGRKVLAFEIPD